MSLQIPQKLSNIRPYLIRAKEVSEREPVIAYFCKYYATKLAIQHEEKDEEVLQFISDILTDIEKLKEALDGDPKWSEIIKDDKNAAAYFETFVLKIFARADTEDREGQATKITARNFLVASQFLEVMAAFGEISVKNQEKIKYAKWKARDIITAIKEGRQPAPGPPSGDNLDTQTTEMTTSPVMDKEAEADSVGPSEDVISRQRPSAQDILNWPSPPANAQATSPAIATDAAAAHPYIGYQQSVMVSRPSPATTVSPSGGYPPIQSAQQLIPNRSPQHQQPPHPGSAHGLTITAQPYGHGGNGGDIMYPQINPAPKAASAFQGQQTYDSNVQQQPSLPNVPTTRLPPTYPQFTSLKAQNPSPTASYISSQPTDAYRPVPSAVAPSPVSIPSSVTSISNRHPEAVPQDLFLDPDVVKQAQKHARWAISALEYDDIKTAIENLERAIHALKTNGGSRKA